MKAVLVYGIPDLPVFFAVLFYDTKLVYFLSMCFNAIIWVHKIQQVYDPKI